MYRYRIVGDTATYGGPKNFSKDHVIQSDKTLMECIEYVKTRVEDTNIDIDTILSTKEDPMGTYHRYMIERDYSVDTVWSWLDKLERKEVFRLAFSEMDKTNPLYHKLKGVML